jgi:PTS system nitrogen regulatory IIA component
MEIADVIAPAGVVVGLRARDKRQVLEELTRRAAAGLGLDSGVVFALLLAREELGSTGVGRGIAVPHARVPGLSRVCGLLARLERPVDFAAIDDKPVDLVCLLLTPAAAAAADHLPALACVSRRLREKAVADRLRTARDGAALYAALTDLPPSQATAV